MKKISFICSLILLISLMLTSCAKQEGATVNTPVNQNLLQVKTFTISTDLAADNTSAVGDIYFQKTAFQSPAAHFETSYFHNRCSSRSCGT